MRPFLYRPISRLSLTVPLVAVVLVTACDSPSGSRRGRVPAAVEVVSPNPQAGTAGAPLAAPVAVRVVDSRDRPVAGQPVAFIVTGGGGSVAVPVATTDAEGLAQTTWTLGTSTAAPQTLEARVAHGANTFTAAFAATISAAAPATITAFPDADTARVGSPGAPVTDSLAVLVRDAFGNPVPGVQVAWTAGTGGTLASPSTTDAQGVARTRWTLGGSTTEEQQLAQAAIQGVGVVRFRARVATELTKSQGDGFTSTVGTRLFPRVLVTGPSGNVEGAKVRWQVTGGGGTVSPAESVTDWQGFATTEWTMGAPGPQTLTATMGGLTTTFTATVLPQGSRTMVAQVPGRVLDVSATRLLWVDAAAPRAVRVRDRASGADAVVAAEVAADPTAGHLFTGGAVVVVPTGAGTETVLEARGALPAAPLATITPRSASFDGDYAAWRQETTVFRRDLATGTTIQIAENAFPEDVGPNGDVLYNEHPGLRRWRDGTVTDVPNGESEGPQGHASTDGVNVAFETFDGFLGRRRIWVAPGGTGTPVFLTSASTSDPGWPDYGRIHDLNGGWTAYSKIEQRFTDGVHFTRLQIRRRSPAGVDEGVTPPDGSGFMVDAVGPDGAVVYRTADRRFLAPAGGGTLDLGPAASGERVVFRDGSFYLISGGSVFRLSA